MLPKGERRKSSFKRFNGNNIWLGWGDKQNKGGRSEQRWRETIRSDFLQNDRAEKKKDQGEPVHLKENFWKRKTREEKKQPVRKNK